MEIQESRFHYGGAQKRSIQKTDIAKTNRSTCGGLLMSGRAPLWGRLCQFRTLRLGDCGALALWRVYQMMIVAV